MPLAPQLPPLPLWLSVPDFAVEAPSPHAVAAETSWPRSPNVPDGAVQESLKPRRRDGVSRMQARRPGAEAGDGSQQERGRVVDLVPLAEDAEFGL